MDLKQRICQLLKEPVAGCTTSSAYDTAWVARLSELGEPIGESALEWLRAHQLADGSWGATLPRYYHDRVICTLAAMTALARQGRPKDRLHWQRAQLALETSTQGLGADPSGATVGFELIAPTLLAEAQSLGILRPRDGRELEHLSKYRTAKLAKLPERTISRLTTVAHSAEMAGPDGLQLLDIDNLQEKNGSVAHSPSATAYFALYGRRQDPQALNYLRRVMLNGSAPGMAPFDVFERAWILWNLALAGPLDAEIVALCQPHLDLLQAAWQVGRGVGFTSDYAPKDGDDTSLVFEVLTHFGRCVDLAAILHYEEKDHFRCFDFESNPSISTNAHVLSVFRQVGFSLEHTAVTKILKFLWRSQTLQLFWFDKWQTSPYYTTVHTIIACAGFVNWLADDAVYWILATQNPDGSWGYYLPTAEETAYSLQALIIWKRSGGRAPDEAIKRGVNWLAAHTEPPYPPLWIEKCLYSPDLIIQSAIFSALLLAEQGW